MMSCFPSFVNRLWVKRLLGVASVVVPLFLLGVVFGPSLLGHVRQSFSPVMINEDACQHVAPYLQYSMPQVFRDDYIARYFEACHPVGYRAIMRVGAWAMTPQRFSQSPRDSVERKLDGYGQYSFTTKPATHGRADSTSSGLTP